MISKEEILDLLYEFCKVRTYSSKEIYFKMAKSFGMNPSIGQEEEIIELIKKYKFSSKDLEFTITKIHDILSVGNTSDIFKINGDDDHY